MIGAEFSAIVPGRSASSTFMRRNGALIEIGYQMSSNHNAEKKYPLLSEILTLQQLPLKATYTVGDVAELFRVSRRAIRTAWPPVNSLRETCRGAPDFCLRILNLSSPQARGRQGVVAFSPTLCATLLQHLWYRSVRCVSAHSQLLPFLVVYPLSLHVLTENVTLLASVLVAARFLRILCESNSLYYFGGRSFILLRWAAAQSRSLH